ncbi:putative ankyrin repeat-containing [Diplodia seriata]|uniref:Putative ankyrin repeat-containing n=1 Tax=Diplodia seriata TaxID=420778 RepID=A0A0G2E6S8_9PEZI|nr:putative ankyrin repeat-containing [Diplodia seriata]
MSRRGDPALLQPLDEVLPPCGWRRLREWLVALLGCTLDLANGETEAKTCPFWVCETRLDKILRDFDEGGGGGRDRLWYCVDVVGIRSIFAWVLHTQVDGRFWGFVRDSANVSERLGCKGIWWDTICVPEDDDARKTAILRMNSDYENAAFTVIHDASLVNFEWREDGSPCVALFLSDWFTRGWTAIELCISRHVKVLFKDPDFPNGPPLIKDLDKDVLPSAKHLCHLGVRNAQHIITKFREFRHENKRPSGSNTRSMKIRKSGLINDFKNLTDVVATRTTSRKKDEMVIAGLLGLEELDKSLDSASITKQIIAR